jgi:hypothetical protein
MSRTCCLILSAVLAVVFLVTVDAADAGRRRNWSATLEEGVNRRGNDIARMEFHGTRRFKSSASQHFTLEEYLYGPGDQSRVWHRPRGERLNPRSDFFDPDCGGRYGGSW